MPAMRWELPPKDVTLRGVLGFIVCLFRGHRWILDTEAPSSMDPKTCLRCDRLQVTF